MKQRSVVHSIALVLALIVYTKATFAQDTSVLPGKVPVFSLYSFQEITHDSPREFSGIYLNGDAATLLVKRGHLAAAQAKAVARAATIDTASAGGAENTPVSIKLQEVDRSWEDLMSIRRSIEENHEWISANGSKLLAWGISVRTNSVSIGVSAINANLEAEASKRFGDSVTLYETELGVPTYTRLNDLEPYSGGSRIIGNLGNACTTGFAIQKNSGTWEPWRLLTAGHCGPVGTTFKTPAPASNTVGTVITSQVPNNGVDKGTIGGSNYYGGIYVGGLQSGDYKPSNGVVVPVVGQGVCSGGAGHYFSGENCTWAVWDWDMCLSFTDSITRCHLYRAIRFTYQPLIYVDQGDSGGPVYTNATENGAEVVKAVGTIIGAPTGNGNAFYFHMFSDMLPSADWGIAIW